MRGIGCISHGQHGTGTLFIQFLLPVVFFSTQDTVALWIWKKMWSWSKNFSSIITIIYVLVLLKITLYKGQMFIQVLRSAIGLGYFLSFSLLFLLWPFKLIGRSALMNLGKCFFLFLFFFFFFTELFCFLRLNKIIHTKDFS